MTPRPATFEEIALWTPDEPGDCGTYHAVWDKADGKRVVGIVNFNPPQGAWQIDESHAPVKPILYGPRWEIPRGFHEALELRGERGILGDRLSDADRARRDGLRQRWGYVDNDFIRNQISHKCDGSLVGGVIRVSTAVQDVDPLAPRDWVCMECGAHLSVADKRLVDGR